MKNITQIHQRNTAEPCRSVRLVFRRHTRLNYRGDHRDRTQHLQRQGALRFPSSRPAGLMEIRAGLAVPARPQFRPDEDALLQAIRSLHRRPERGAGTHQIHRFAISRNRITQSGSTLPRAQSNPQSITLMSRQRFTISTSGSTRLFNTSGLTLTRPAQASTEKQQSSSEASEGAPTHTSTSASKIFFSDQDEIPGLGDEAETLTPSETIRRRAQEMEKLYRQDCRTLGTVVKMLISKHPALQQKLQTAMTEILLDIKRKNLEKLSLFISEVNASAKP
ncbi:periphilin-1 [Danio aesculapii]|uniref:periphilin-1 n=1 Tax=Danio aesculapii TaxID=1142201 RepID=UPI0024BF6220|nr:periphilin-1 [Danio aesculapii]